MDVNYQHRYLKKIDALLNEGVYTLPTNGRTAMADLYTLYHLWWLYGGGKEAYGYARTDPIIPSRLSEKIDDYFEHAVFLTAKKISEELMMAIYEELENMVGEYIIPDQNSVKNYLEDHNIRLPEGPDGELILPPVHDFWQKHSLGDAYKMFLYPGWVNPKSNQYGGKKWADIVNATRDLISAWKSGRRSKDVKDVMYAVDKLYDIEHNTGAIGDKLQTMSVDRASLDKRHEAKSLQDLVNLGVSPQVKNLSKAAAHFAKDDAITETRVRKSTNWETIIRGRYTPRSY